MQSNLHLTDDAQDDDTDTTWSLFTLDSMDPLCISRKIFHLCQDSLYYCDDHTPTLTINENPIAIPRANRGD